ncbi:MAG: bifunctional glutamate N-acetyltransferase/amino-acid acetyltransferase ArgJ [Deltaproteobacteria bacterium]|nr:bifunctional glutamate N-acetyltransferase/amino-acid acetyltransferase ArgJ [Deltaproteobacteria bacterium]
MKKFPHRSGVPGFRFAGIAGGLKKNGDKDIGLILADAPCAAAAAFTKNIVKAAPVLIGRKRLRDGCAQAVLVNSGNANACTGSRGMRDAEASCAALARELGIRQGLVLPGSTGVIGVPLPVDKITSAVPRLVRAASPSGAADFCAAIMTTDTFPKIVALEDTVAGRPLRVCGIAKGAGMIMPNMATMLCYIVTDVAIDRKLLSAVLRQQVELTFNRITVDGDMSTNDTVLALASGKSKIDINKVNSITYNIFINILHEVMKRLATLIVKDGEGATKTLVIQVRNARTEGQAKQAAMTVANSPLVKTAFFGQDYNWGRIMAALGRSGAQFAMDRVDIFFNAIQSVKNGQGVERNIPKLQTVMKKGTIAITVDLKAGAQSCEVTTCDLSYDYVKINADYTT